MLLITDPDVKQVLRVEDIIDDMERAFAEEARGVAVNRPRTRYKVPPDRDSDGYMANIIPGAVPSSGVAALRYDSMVVRERMVDGLKRMDYPYPARRSWGFVLLFSLETAEPLAIIHDFSLSSIRVGATTGVAVRSLSREDSRVVGLFGSGNEAEQNLAAICAVRDVREARVYSVTRQHRERFAMEMTGKLDIQVRPVDNARAVVEGADIVMCATNASAPVFDGDWLVPGQFVTTIVNTDGVHSPHRGGRHHLHPGRSDRAQQPGDRAYQPAAGDARSHRRREDRLGQDLRAGPGPHRREPRAQERRRDHLLQEQHRCRHPVRRGRRGDLRGVQEEGPGPRAAHRVVRRRPGRVAGQGLFAFSVGPAAVRAASRVLVGGSFRQPVLSNIARVS